MIYEIWGLFTIHKCSEAYFKQPNLLCPGADCTPLLKFIILHFLILSAMLKCVLLPRYYNLVLKSTMTSVLGPVRLWWPLFFLVRATLYLSAKEAHKVVLFPFVDILLLRISHETCHRVLVQRKFFLFFLPQKKYPRGRCFRHHTMSQMYHF